MVIRREIWQRTNSQLFYLSSSARSFRACVHPHFSVVAFFSLSTFFLSFFPSISFFLRSICVNRIILPAVAAGSWLQKAPCLAPGMKKLSQRNLLYVFLGEPFFSTGGEKGLDMPNPSDQRKPEREGRIPSPFSASSPLKRRL